MGSNFMYKIKLDRVSRDFIKTSFGNVLEWYDFTIYGLFALQISQAFFPKNIPFISLLLVFVTFAVGFLARPLGSFIFGVIGDRRGKHYAVNLSIWVMAVPTTLIGFLPGYQQIGMLSPMLLVVLRICQGISAGGQFSGLIAIAVDSDAKNKPFLVSLIYTISVVGCLAAALIGSVSIAVFGHVKSDHSFINSLSWRIPFILSIVIFLIYTKMVPEFRRHNLESSHKFTLPEIFSRQPRELTYMAILNFTTGTIYYILFTYLVTFLQEYLHLGKQTSFMVMNTLLIFSIILYPLFGYFAGGYNCRIKHARKYVIVMMAAVILFALIKDSFWLGIVGLTGMVITFCAITSLVTSLFAEVFDERYRMTACSLSFNLGITLAGFAPLIAEISSTFWKFGLAGFLEIILVIMYYVLCEIVKTHGYLKNVIN